MIRRPPRSTLFLHDALPISERLERWATLDGHDGRRLRVSSALKARRARAIPAAQKGREKWERRSRDRKSTRLNSSHSSISYAVFCLKKKKELSIMSPDLLI